MRRLLLFLGLLGVLVQQGIGGASQDPPPDGLPAPPQPFERWLADLQSEALARGYDASVVQHLADLQPLERVIAADRSQAELNPGFDRYLSSRVTPLMVKRGKEHARANATILRRVEKQFDDYGMDLPDEARTMIDAAREGELPDVVKDL
jgi:membrane-bound lytic murein transglycosylase B